MYLTQDLNKKFLTKAEFCDFCGISESTGYKLMKNRKVDFGHNPFSLPKGGVQTLEAAKTDADKGLCGINDNMYKSTFASYSLSDSHIFLPSAGLWHDGSFISGGYYWSSSKAKDVLDKNAWNIVMGSSYIFNGLEIRVYGMPVRPVFKP